MLFVERGNFEFPWMIGFLTKVLFFIWTAARNQLPTVDNLQKRCFFLSNVCPLCSQDAESIDYIFIHCVYAREVWNGVFGVMAVGLVFPSSFNELLCSWKTWNFSLKGRVLWRLILPIVCWSLWLERN